MVDWRDAGEPLWSAEQQTLAVGEAEVACALQLRFGLDALGHDRHAEHAGHGHTRAQHHLVEGAARQRGANR